MSTQVLQEFYVTVTRKLSRPLPHRTAREVVATYRTWPVHRPDVDDVVAASELEERHQLSFWDALIIVSARRSGARSLLTEALQDGQRFDGLEVVSPFRDVATGEHSTGLDCGPQRIGTQHLVDEEALDTVAVAPELIPSVRDDRTVTGEPMPNLLSGLRRSRSGH